MLSLLSAEPAYRTLGAEHTVIATFKPSRAPGIFSNTLNETSYRIRRVSSTYRYIQKVLQSMLAQP